MPLTPPTDRDWFEVDNSGPLAIWCEFLPGNDVSQLRGRQLRNSDITVGGRTGVFPVARDVDALTVTLLGCLFGIFDLDGGPVTGAEEVNAQLDTNRDWLVAEVFDPPGTADGTRTGTLHRVGGNVYTGAVIIDGKLGITGDTPVSQNFALTVVCVDGGLDLEGS